MDLTPYYCPQFLDKPLSFWNNGSKLLSKSGDPIPTLLCANRLGLSRFDLCGSNVRKQSAEQRPKAQLHQSREGVTL
jgi:hypothetical protein